MKKLKDNKPACNIGYKAGVFKGLVLTFYFLQAFILVWGPPWFPINGPLDLVYAYTII